MQQILNPATQPAATPTQHGRAGNPLALPLRDRHRSRQLCRYDARAIAPSFTYVLRAPWSHIQNTLLHEIAHAIVGTDHADHAA